MIIRNAVIYASVLLSLLAGAILPTVARAQQQQSDPVLFWANIINAQNVLSILVFLVVIGVGRWFNNKGWPWVSEFMEKRQDRDYEIRKLAQEQEMELRQGLQALTRETLQSIGNVSYALGEITQLMRELKSVLREGHNGEKAA